MSKVLKACMALVALAALTVLPATASAENDATAVDVNNNPLPVGSLVIGTDNHGTTKITNAAGETRLSCTTNELTGELIKNSHTAIEGTITSATFKGEIGKNPHTTHCTSPAGPTLFTPNPATNGLHWCVQIRAVDTTDTFLLRGGGCGGAVRPIRITTQTTTPFGTSHCEFERATAMSGTYVTGAKPTLHLVKQEFKLVGGNPLCQSEVFLDMTMQLWRHSKPHSELKLLNST